MDREKNRHMDAEVTDTPEETRGTVRQTEERIPEDRTPVEPDEERLSPLFGEETADKFRSRWLAIQSRFVDDPRDSVQQADDLVSDVIESITASFADRRGSMEKEWNSGGDTSTEDLRIALKQYRSFFERLLRLES